jgi:CheY-like chemotaxis protein
MTVEPQHGAGTAARRCVLVADDDPDIRLVVREILEDEGCIVAEAPDGAVALEVAKREQPALILLDMKMPVMDGWAFAAAYQELPLPRAPVVVVTAARDAAARAAEVGADAHLGKPFEIDELLRVVGRFADCARH